MAHLADAKRLLDERGYTGQLVRGDNPLKLFDKALRDRVTESYYWKEQCFGLNAATLLDRVFEITYIGGVTASQRPSPFLCLLFKMLQILPEREIIMFYLQTAGEEFKYLRALAAFYIRLVWEKDEEIYATLEPYLNDARKLRRRTREGWQLTFVDDFIDSLLTKPRVCGVVLPHLNPRGFLEDEDRLEPRVSALGDELDEPDDDRDEADVDGDDEREEEGGAQVNGHADTEHDDAEDQEDQGNASHDGD